MSESLDSLSVGFKTIFQKRFNETMDEGRNLATIIPSNSKIEKYAWLGNFPNMQKWVGDRNLGALKDYDYVIANEMYEASIAVSLLDIEYDKIGMYKPAIEQMALESKRFGGNLISKLLENGETNKSYDKAAFFGTHKVGATNIKNLGKGELTSENLLSAATAMMSVTNEQGSNMGIRPSTLVTSPENLALAIKAVSKEYLAGGETNPTFKMFNLVILRGLTGKAWYLLDTTAPIKPFVLQIAKEGIFTKSNEQEFMKNNVLYGTQSFMNAGYALWQLAYKSNGVNA